MKKTVQELAEEYAQTYDYTRFAFTPKDVVIRVFTETYNKAQEWIEIKRDKHGFITAEAYAEINKHLPILVKDKNSDMSVCYDYAQDGWDDTHYWVIDLKDGNNPQK